MVSVATDLGNLMATLTYRSVFAGTWVFLVSWWVLIVGVVGPLLARVGEVGGI